MQLQTHKHMMDVLRLKHKHLVRHQVLGVSPSLLVHHIRQKQDVFKELMEFVSGKIYLNQAMDFL